tara:strand:+ start:1159 stop:1404 length:246 start_codon:yes stop_codon:yes gene_type:complete
MAISFDNRPTVFGNLMVVTGTFANSDTSVDLSGYLADIVSFTAMENDTSARAVVVSYDGTTAYFTEAGTGGGRFMAMGHRN